MNSPKGNIQKHIVKPHLRHFCPVRFARELIDVEPEHLASEGKRLVLLDADNTILLWRSEDIPASSRAWIEQAKSVGLNLCIISNTRNKERLNRLSNELAIPFAEGKFKPSKEMYAWALKHFNVTSEETVMIGDQIFTDIFGANRSGIEAILLRPMGSKEFAGTKINRTLEKLVHPSLRNAMESAPDDLEFIHHTGIFKHKIVRQLTKFCIVGGTSFLINYNIRMTLVDKTTVGGQRLSDIIGGSIRSSGPFFHQLFDSNFAAFFPIAALCGAAFAIVNSFYLNRLWTFEVKNSLEKAKQFKKFLVISITGSLLDTAISTTINGLLNGDEKSVARIATICAALIVGFWNFFGQRLYAFKASKNA